MLLIRLQCLQIILLSDAEIGQNLIQIELSMHQKDIGQQIFLLKPLLKPFRYMFCFLQHQTSQIFPVTPPYVVTGGKQCLILLIHPLVIEESSVR